jgi:hypothetical protein
MTELQGMADGAAVDFAHLLIMNLRMELDYFHKLEHSASHQRSSTDSNDAAHATARVNSSGSRIDQCSDYLIKTDGAALLIHNEGMCPPSSVAGFAWAAV